MERLAPNGIRITLKLTLSLSHLRMYLQNKGGHNVGCMYSMVTKLREEIKINGMEKKK